MPPNTPEELERRHKADLAERIELHYRLEKEIKIGEACNMFFNSAVGRFILDKATMDAQRAKDQLATLSLSDYDSVNKYLDAIRDLQQQAHIPALVCTWLDDAIQSAREAHIQLSNEEIKSYGDY